MSACSHGAPHCKGDFVAEMKAWHPDVVVRREAASRLALGQLCQAHKDELHVLVAVPKHQSSKTR